MSENWIDVSVPLYSGMAHWPDNPEVVIERMQDMEQGDVCTVSRLSLGVHTGTHIDAPAHFISGGAGVHEAPFEALIGAARLLEIRDPVSVKVEELEPYRIQAGERILFKTRNSLGSWESTTFVPDFVYVSADAASYLASLKVRTVGVDYLSVGGFYADGPETHHALLSAGVWIIEGMNFAGVDPGRYQLVCLPLRIQGADGAPARVILQPMES